MSRLKYLHYLHEQISHSHFKDTVKKIDNFINILSFFLFFIME